MRNVTYDNRLDKVLFEYDNGDLIIRPYWPYPNMKAKRISRATMQQLAAHYTGMNRIHQPLSVLFWRDCKNGKAFRWKQETSSGQPA